jgi:lipopolysaccharide assembly outer membrane protein LptD (OstA)
MILSRHKQFLRPCLLILCLCIAQQGMFGQRTTTLDILNADITAQDSKIGLDATKLIGNVKLKHEDVIMTCDSAYFYQKTSSVDAFSNVFVRQGDTLTLQGDFAYYNGITRLARVRHNVVLVNKDITLLTDSLNYNRTAGYASYLGGGILTQADSRLTSGRGRYILDTEDFYFMDTVVIVNPDYTIHTDSMRYNTREEISYFGGPTEIIGEGRYIYCENGWYNMRNDNSYVSENAYMEEEGRILKGDSLYYEAEQGFGTAWSNVELIDTAQNMTLKGNYGLYYRDQESAMVTDSALMIQVDGTDTMYIHADTLRSVQNPDFEEQSRILRAYYKVKIFRHDLQVMCDSLVYVEADSVFDFYGEPVIWSDENQLTASHIRIFMVDQQLERMHLSGVAFVASQKDSVSFDQMRGKEMTGYFIDNKLDRILVSGNGQTIYYATDQELVVGANKTVCSDLTIYLKDNKISRVVYLSQPEGTYYPLDMFPAGEALLSDFKWLERWRPLKWEDVFIWK